MKIRLLFSLILSFALLSVSGFYPLNKNTFKAFKKEFALVPGGTTKLAKKTISTAPFILSKTVITNAAYLLFLADLLEEGEDGKYQIAKIQTENWEAMGNEAMGQIYHTNEAFKDYPVVNISKEGAELYCEWLSKKYKEAYPDKESLTFRLPTKDEWLRAANGGSSFSYSYSWLGPYVRNSKGEILARFKHIGAESIHQNEKGEYIIMENADSNDNRQEDGVVTDLMAPAKSYYPSILGFYNLNGNIAEMLADEREVIGGSWMDTGYDIRNESVKAYTGAEINVGFRVTASVEGWN